MSRLNTCPCNSLSFSRGLIGVCEILSKFFTSHKLPPDPYACSPSSLNFNLSTPYTTDMPRSWPITRLATSHHQMRICVPAGCLICNRPLLLQLPALYLPNTLDLPRR